MQVNESKNGDIVVLSVSGRLDSNTSLDFEEKVIASIKSGERKVVLDFGTLEYISSAGLRVLLKATREAKAESWLSAPPATTSRRSSTSPASPPYSPSPPTSA